MTTYIANAFALSMVPDGVKIITRTVNLPSVAKKLSKPVSVVGHADTAKVFSNLLGIEIVQNRVSISLTDKDTLYVGQVMGGRLAEGSTTLPEGVSIKWICVQIDPVPVPIERHWTKNGSSVYGSIDKAAESVAEMFQGGSVQIMQDAWGNPHWEIKAIGFYGHLWDE